MGYRKILIVGENNLCRSFMAEVILRGLLKKKNVSETELLSRGLVVLFSEPVSPMAVAVLRHHGYEISEFRSSQLTEEDLESADLALTMTKTQAEQVRTNYEAQIACMSVGTFIDMEEEVPEVTEDTPEAFEKCFRSIESLMEAAADRIIGELLL
ncbi:MAG TPA: hypothetical protein H9849_09660 [Candidatus Anaerobutyricum stercoripullorum]|uniref:Phosphotyrosine protein phosphatase I domain-containing protein n=1 Tax=Candidatus Anaerobutyricum stercoripullorum TaxID=2838456 RepID=A0A9D2BEN4_9FIRM|nr:hypothetical protein [Candidatus Anaerobutyricum stercoripullorum]